MVGTVHSVIHSYLRDLIQLFLSLLPAVWLRLLFINGVYFISVFYKYLIMFIYRCLFVSVCLCLYLLIAVYL